MATLTFSARAPETIERGPWTSHDSYELFLFLVQSCGFVCAGVLLYSLGPAVGIAVLLGSLVAWSKRASRSTKCLADEDGGHDEPATSMSDAGTARLRNDLVVASTAKASRPVLRQGA